MVQIIQIGYGALSWMDRNNPHEYNQTHAKQQVILEKVAKAYQERSKESKVPLLGEFVEMPDGKILRICSVWKDWTTTELRLQLIPAGSFFDNGEGQSYSGSLWPSLEASRLVLTDDMRDGTFWFFADGWPGADRGVSCMMPYRVWQLPSMEGVSSYYKEYAENDLCIGGY